MASRALRYWEESGWALRRTTEYRSRDSRESDTKDTIPARQRESEATHVYFNTEHHDVMSSVCCYLHHTWQTVTHLDLNLRHWFHTQKLMGCTKCQFLHNVALKIARTALFNIDWWTHSATVQKQMFYFLPLYIILIALVTCSFADYCIRDK